MVNFFRVDCLDTKRVPRRSKKIDDALYKSRTSFNFAIHMKPFGRIYRGRRAVELLDRRDEKVLSYWLYRRNNKSQARRSRQTGNVKDSIK